MTHHAGKPDVAKKPLWGRAALLSVLGAVLLSYVGVASNVLPDAGWAVVLLLGQAAGVTLAIVSLAKGEKRILAIVTLCLVLVVPAVVAIGFVVFFGFFYRG